MHGSGVHSIPHTEPILDVSCVQTFCAASLQAHADHAHLQHKQTKSIIGKIEFYTIFLVLCAHGWCATPSGKHAYSEWLVWNAEHLIHKINMHPKSENHAGGETAKFIQFAPPNMGTPNS